MKTSGPFAVLNAIAVLLILGGAFGLLAFFGGQMQHGSASDLNLIGGGGAVILGIIFLVLADLGTRLVRLETRLGTLPKDDFSEERRFPAESGGVSAAESSVGIKPITN